MAETKSVFETLNSIDCSKHVEQKNGLTYLSWAWAWGILKKNYPDAMYTIYENAEGWNYFTDGKTCWVKTGVTVGGLEHIEYLPVMDFKNKSIPAESVTSFEVNKAIQRSLTKAVARHGLGLYIYAGEDLPEAPTVGKDEMISSIKAELERTGFEEKAIFKAYSIKTFDDVTPEIYRNMMARFKKTPNKKTEAKA